MFFVGINYSLHITKTDGKLNHDYITGSCYKRKLLQSLGNIGSGSPNLMMQIN